MKKETMVFNAIIAGNEFPIKIEKEKEATHRQANELLNKRYEMYQKMNKNGLSKGTIMTMTAYSLSVQVAELQNLLEMITDNKK